jgi:thiamine-monophosphate kinase
MPGASSAVEDPRGAGELDPATAAITVGGLGEAGLLRRILPRLQGAPALLGPGDDAALVAAPDGRFVITVDTLVQDQDFRLEWPNGYRARGYDVGWKSAAQNLSDVNAMGAEATSAVISLTLPPDTPVSWVEDLADGFAAAVRQLGAGRCSIAGGDLGRGSEVAITAAVTGSLDGRDPVLRSGALAGDVVAVCGRLGHAAAGWALLETGPPMGGLADRESGLVGLQVRPRPPLAAGPAAAAAGASAMMDLSDGLLKDAGRLAAASGVAVRLEGRQLGDDIAGLEATASSLGGDAATWVLTGGEDHGLLATFPARSALPAGFRPIGVVEASSTPGVVVAGEVPGPGRWRTAAAGFDHFKG